MLLICLFIYFEQVKALDLLPFAMAVHDDISPHEPFSCWLAWWHIFRGSVPALKVNLLPCPIAMVHDKLPHKTFSSWFTGRMLLICLFIYFEQVKALDLLPFAMAVHDDISPHEPFSCWLAWWHIFRSSIPALKVNLLPCSGIELPHEALTCRLLGRMLYVGGLDEHLVLHLLPFPMAVDNNILPDEAETRRLLRWIVCWIRKGIPCHSDSLPGHRVMVHHDVLPHEAFPCRL